MRHLTTRHQRLTALELRWTAYVHTKQPATAHNTACSSRGLHNGKLTDLEQLSVALPLNAHLSINWSPSGVPGLHATTGINCC
ncbi:MAG TPA: hypothetical protein VNM22_11450 [Candidatus Limnocylindrales bacterium]|nr:hypothetical protein [Candidatus Limnocylindrales bacterium]